MEVSPWRHRPEVGRGRVTPRFVVLGWIAVVVGCLGSYTLEPVAPQAASCLFGLIGVSIVLIGTVVR